MKEQTAVEWFAIQLYEKMEMKGDGEIINSLLEQANEMFKNQIIHAGNTCAMKGKLFAESVNKMSEEEITKYLESNPKTHGEDYYNETYKDNDK